MAEYIERKKALKAVCPYEDGDYFQEVNVLLKCIELVPAADVAQVVHGRWRWVGECGFNDCYICSECGKIAMNDSNYCPNCGSKMDKEATDGLYTP